MGIQKEKTEKKDNALDSFLFYGKTEASAPKEDNNIGWSYEEYEAEENRIEEFIKEKPRKVMDPTLLKDLQGEDTPPNHSSKGFGGIIKAVCLVLVVAIAFCGAYVYLSKDPKQYDKVNSKLTALVDADNGSIRNGILEKYEELLELNPDMAGYLKISEKAGKAYEMPVVKMGESGADYLKKHLFDGTANSYGTVYTKSDIRQDKTPSVIILQGVDKGDLRGLSAINTYTKDNDGAPTLSFDTLYEEGEWAIFSAFSFKNGQEPFLMDRQSFLNENLFREYINNYYEHSQNIYDVDAAPSDTLLILVAEGEKETQVVAARNLRQNETADALEKRKVVETTTDKNDKQPEKDTSSKTETSEGKPTESDKTTSVEGGTSSTTSVSKPSAPTRRPNNMRYEQTGLTADMDKTAKVEMSNIVTLVDVTGLQKDKAKSILEDTLGLKVEIKTVESEQKRGTVLKQSVVSGAQISADIPVVLTVSGGLAEGKAMVPDLVGNAESNAKMILADRELKLGKVAEAESSLEAGTILSQSPKAGSEVDYDTPIDIVVSNGLGKIKIIEMPRLTSLTEEEASAAIKEAGLRVGKIKTVTSSKTAGTVVAQECPAGERIEEGSTVGFSISNGSKVNNLTVTNISSWSVTVGGKTYASGDIIKGDYMDIIPYIVEAEMGGGFNMEALKAQAVAAYCWLINSGSEKGAAPGVPMKNPTDKAISAAESVKGIKVLDGSTTAQTYYYAIAADYSANCKDVWWADIPYLRAVPSEGDKYADGYKTTVTYTADELKERVAETYGIDLSGVNKNKWFNIKYDENKAYVRSVDIGGKKTVTGSSMRDSLLQYELRSTAFKLKYNKSNDTFTFTVRGYGHGVGMSQVGANYYAGKGWDYQRILTHYYPGTRVG